MYSEKAVDHAVNPRNLGRLEHPAGHARITGPCGDTMEFWVAVDAGRIQEVKFWTDGCGATVACGSVTTELSADRTLDEALLIEQADILGALGGLPEENVHCALLAATTLRETIRDAVRARKGDAQK